ncbi:MAG: 1-acyl-sn-glycerol-3-phosphate acyltransferase [Desulfuromonas sp.]|mgnify:CR=1 FL=1|nr:MAG: 1-acyl-sn-glycerol-3-phosphate acyltransferase [Desulfuromonas sp.]
MLRTLFFFTLFGPWTLLSMSVGIPLSFLSPDYLHNVARFWGKGCLLLGGAKLDVTGIENIPTDRPVIFMPNHQSNFDIPALFSAIPGQFRWLAKMELFKVPLFGLTMRRSGYIPIDRSNRRKSLESIRLAAQRISNGTSVVIFPEGTRTSDGKLQLFKKGGFHLALQAGVSVIPVTIDGSYAMMPKHRTRIDKGSIRVTFHPELPGEDLVGKAIDDVMEQVRQPLASTLSNRSAA